MKVSGRNDAAVVEFAGKVQRIARVHHYGLRDKPWRNSKLVKYDTRLLLGLQNEDLAIVERVIAKKLWGE